MIQICPPDCPNRKPGCHSSCPDYPRRLAEYHAEQAYNREQKARISDSIRGVIATCRWTSATAMSPGIPGGQNGQARGGAK